MTRSTFLWLGALLGLFVGPRARQCRTSTPTHTVPSPAVEIIHPELGPVRSPQPQPRLASRARRRSPDSATFQRETRAHQRTTFPHPTSRFRTLRCPTPTEVDPSCEQRSTGEPFSRTTLWLAPRRRLPHRPRHGELAMRAATQRPTQPRLEHPAVVDSPLVEPEEDWSSQLANRGLQSHRPRERVGWS